MANWTDLPPEAPRRINSPAVNQSPVVIQVESDDDRPGEVVITGIDVSWRDLSWFAFRFALATVISLGLIYFAALALYGAIGFALVYRRF